MGDRAAKSELFDQFARVGKALGSGKRLELLDVLAQSERTVDSLARTCGMGLTTTSAHLQTLKQANLVTTRRSGTRVFYRLAGRDVAQLLTLVRNIAAERLPDVHAARSAYLGPDIDQIGREELLERARTGRVTVLDVRPRDEYDAGHIPGAVSIPIDELPRRLAELPPDQQVVAYCRGAYCVFAHEAVRLLTGHGRPAARLADGMLEWRLAGLPIETAVAGGYPPARW